MTEQEQFCALPKEELCGAPRIVEERISEAVSRRFYVLSADIDAHGHTEGCSGCAALAPHGRAIEPRNNECRERIRTIIERTLTGKARMNAYKDGVAETQSEGKKGQKERELSKVQEMCLWNPRKWGRWRIDMQPHLARNRNNTKRTQ